MSRQMVGYQGMTRLSTEIHFFTDAVICQEETLIVDVCDVLTTSCNNNKLLSTKKNGRRENCGENENLL